MWYSESSAADPRKFSFRQGHPWSRYHQKSILDPHDLHLLDRYFRWQTSLSSISLFVQHFASLFCIGRAASRYPSFPAISCCTIYLQFHHLTIFSSFSGNGQDSDFYSYHIAPPPLSLVDYLAIGGKCPGHFTCILAR